MFLDLKSAARSLWHRPVFFASAVLTLGLGFGAALATFGVVDRLLLRPMSYPDPERLVFITGVLPGDSGPGASLSFTEIGDISRRSKAIATISACAAGSFDWMGWLWPRPMILSSTTTTAPTGTSPPAAACAASFKASCMNPSRLRGSFTSSRQTTP